MKVYVGSLWHEDCDPFVTVYATTAEKAQEVLDEAAEEEYKHILNSCECDDCAAVHGDTEFCDETTDCECCCEDTIRTGGVFVEEWTEEELVNEAGWHHAEEYRLGDFYAQGYEYSAY